MELNYAYTAIDDRRLVRGRKLWFAIAPLEKWQVTSAPWIGRFERNLTRPFIGTRSDTVPTER
jgi:hypothetical protein